jgi:hypothetical protein
LVKIYIDKRLSELIKSKNYWFQKHRKNRQCAELKERYITCRNLVTIYKRQLQEKRNKIKFQKCGGDKKKMWKNIGELFGKTSNRIVEKHQITPDDFVNYFTSIGRKLADNCEQSSMKININSHSPKFLLKNVSKYKIQKVITKLKNTKSVGVDGIKTDLIKSCSLELSEIIAKIINLSFKLNKVPDCLKISKIIPIFKSGDPDDTGNYRPIAISTVFDKIVQKVVNEQLLEHLEKNKLLYRRQYGFRQNSSTNAANFDIVSEIQKSCDNGHVTTTVFLDLSKAFDTIDRRILLRKLTGFGVTGSSYLWFKDFLSNRKQYVDVNGSISKTTQNDIGVVQGSALSSTLFSCYVNDLSNLELHGTVYQFADDTVLLYSGESNQDVQEKINADLNNVARWMNRMKLTINSKKTKYITYRNSKISAMRIFYNGEEIERVSSFKYLGLYLDERMNFKEHIEVLAKKLSAVAGVFRKLSGIVDGDTRIMIYFALFHSNLTYCLNVWGCTTSENIDIIQKVQNKALRNMFSLGRNHSVRELLDQTRIYSVRKNFKKQCALYMYRIFNSGLLNNVVFHENERFHNFNTRGRKKLRTNQARTMSFGQKSVINSHIRIYNDVDDTLKVLRYNVFKSKISEIL